MLKRGHPTGPQADVYGLAAIIGRVVQERVPAGGVVPAPLAELIAKGTAEHHEARYGDMLELFDRLRDASTEVLAALPVVPCDRDTAPIQVDDGPKTPRGRESRETLPASIEIRAVRAGAVQPPPVHELAAPPPPRGATGPVAVVALGLAAVALGAAGSLAVLLRPPPVVVQVPAPAASPLPSVTAPPAPAAPAPVATSTPPAASPAPPPRRRTLEQLCESEEWYSCTMRRPARR
ncbi:hypothetical protein ACSRUE_38690 [Sorangium sp. KYC3313]|uniref:hypothetical protein n=1 Tax=Sorangium sp. KYC3313 TaxID=3449740 RepID=UPI003F8A871B